MEQMNGYESFLGHTNQDQPAEEETHRRQRELALFNRIITASATHPDTTLILETACRELAQTFELPHAAVAWLDSQNKSATVVAEYVTDASLAWLHLTVPLGKDSPFQYLLRYKAPLAASDAQNDPHLTPLHKLLRQRGIVSLLLVPFVIGGEVVGGVGLESPEVRHFSIAEINLAGRVADLVAGVLARARLEAERRQRQEQSDQAQKMEALGRLTAGMLSDFNHILTAINGFAALVQDQFSPDAPIQEMINKVLVSGQRATGLVHQLLAFNGKQIIEPQALNLSTFVADLAEILRRILGEDIDLKTSLSPELWPVKIDPTQMKQVIVNLAVNASEAMPGGGQLALETANVTLDAGYAASHLGVPPGEYVLLAISDTGLGMSHEVKRHIFEPFFTTKKTGKGTGLGLATVYGIVKQNEGHIRVSSEESRGTTFKIYLPQATESNLAATEMGKEALSGHETILIVEDNAPVRDLVHRVLQKQGYVLLEAQNGQEALRLITHYAGPIHLLLTDIVMPGLSGKTLAEEATHHRLDMKVLYVSGYTDKTIIDHGPIEPGDAFLQKPFNPTALIRKVREVLDS